MGKGRLGARLMGKGKDGEGRTREWESRCAESTVKSMQTKKTELKPT